MRILWIGCGLLLSSLAACSRSAPSSDTTAVTSAAPSPAQEFGIRVVTYGGLQVEQAQVDSLLAFATRLLRERDSQADHIADIVLQREGDVRAEAPSTALEDVDVEALTASTPSSRTIALLPRIQRCDPDHVSGVRGCARIPGRVIAVAVPDIRGSEDHAWRRVASVIAHEFGHNKGLPHRTRHLAVMQEAPEPTTNELCETEARALAIRDDSTQRSRCSVFEEAEAQSRLPVVAFVRREPAEGISILAAMAYSREAGDTLVAMLDAPENARFLGNIAVTLGAIGRTSATQAIVAKLNEPQSELQGSQWIDTKSALLVGLGLLANRPDGVSAARYLLTSAGTGEWLRRTQRWRRDSTVQDAARLEASTIRALSYSARDDAVTLLQRLSTTRIAGADSAASRRLNALARAELTTLQSVKARTLQGYLLLRQ